MHHAIMKLQAMADAGQLSVSRPRRAYGFNKKDAAGAHTVVANAV